MRSMSICPLLKFNKMDKRFRTLIGPYGTRDVIADERYIHDLELLDIDFMAYQDEIGVRKTKLSESEKLLRGVKACA